MILPKRYALRARWVFPVDAPPLEDGRVTVDDQRIAKVGETTDAAEVVDLGDAALLPGLVNAHTHLEFSALEQPLGQAGMPLPDWIRLVITYRSEAADAVETRLARGWQECLAAGVTTVGEIATTPWPRTENEANACRGVLFRELIGLSSARVGQSLDMARDHLAAAPGGWRPGLSPHAPYTVRPDLLEQAVQLANAAGAAVAMHVAESREELQLLQEAGGPFRTLLDDLGAWDAAAIPQGVRPWNYLQALSRARRSLVIHGNYLQEDEIALLARRRRSMSVVYCPRTHAYFQHHRYPLAKLLAAGARVALGTDSRASNPDLSLLEEMRFAARRHNPPLAHVLRTGTLAGAEALGLADEAGSITPGKPANLCVIALPGREERDPHALLFDSDLPVQRVFRYGREVHSVC